MNMPYIYAFSGIQELNIRDYCNRRTEPDNIPANCPGYHAISLLSERAKVCGKASEPGVTFWTGTYKCASTDSPSSSSD